MNIAYVLIPIAAFLILAGLFHILSNNLLFPKGDGKEEWRGRIGDIDLVVAILATANLGARRLRLSVSRRVTYLLVDFEARAAVVSLPIVTARQKKHKDELLGLMARSGEEGGVHEDESGQSSFSVRLQGEPEQIAERLKSLFLKIFDVDENRVLEYTVQSHRADLRELWHRQSRSTGTAHEGAPIAATAGRTEKEMAGYPSGCLFAIAELLLLPIPFLLAYAWSDIFFASVVVLVMLGGRIAFEFIKQGWTLRPLANINWIVTLGGCALTVYFREPYMLQLVPTVLCGIMAIAAFLPLFKGRTVLDDRTPDAQIRNLRGRLLVTASVVVACVIGALINEYLRTNVSLDHWVWYFAYFRLELLLGFAATAAPVSAWVLSHNAKDTQVGSR